MFLSSVRVVPHRITKRNSQIVRERKGERDQPPDGRVHCDKQKSNSNCSIQKRLLCLHSVKYLKF